MSDPKQREQEFLERVSATLAKREAGLDAATLRDLRLARHKALESLQKPRRLWQPLGLAATAATVGVVAIGLYVMQPKAPLTVHSMEDMTLLSAGEDFDLYENLEFYQWLELEKRNG